MLEYNKLPKAIMLIDDIKAHSLRYEKGYKISEDISILGIKEAKALKLQVPSGLNKNEIFFLHPFQEGIYLPVDTDKLALQKVKLNHLFQLAKYLGASRFEASLVYHEEEISGKEGGVGAGTPKIGGNITGKSTNNTLMEMGLKMIKVVKKAENIEYAKAIEYATKHGLINDKEINQFIKSRDPEDESILTDDSFTITTSTEINKSLDFVLEVSALANRFNVKAKYSSDDFKKEKTTLKIDIVF